jgi:PqqD family protein of HPr-rel-A system
MALLLFLAERPLRERRWGLETVVYDVYSGETHYLTSLASAIFHRVATAGSRDLDSLCRELAKPEAGGTEPEDVGSAAARLCGIGLLRAEEIEA